MLKKLFLAAVVLMNVSSLLAETPQHRFAELLKKNTQRLSSGSRSATCLPESYTYRNYQDGIATGEYGTTFYTYDVHGNPTNEVHVNQDNDTTRYQTEYVYDANNRITSKTMQYWDGSQWQDSWRTLYVYDANGYVTSETGQYWNGSQWENMDRDLYTYDANGRITSEIFEQWTGTQWEGNYRDLYTYDANGNIATMTFQSWDGSQWQTDEEYTFSGYDANGNATEVVFQEGTDTYQMEITYTYDANGNMLTATYEWVGLGAERQIITYDANGNKILDIWESYNESTSQWEKYSHAEYTYGSSCTTVGIANRADAVGIQVYPNPSNGKFVVEFDAAQSGEISVYNIAGAKVLSQHLAQQTQANIDISQQPQGIYVIKISGTESVYTRKVMVK